MLKDQHSIDTFKAHRPVPCDECLREEGSEENEEEVDEAHAMGFLQFVTSKGGLYTYGLESAIFNYDCWKCNSTPRRGTFRLSKVNREDFIVPDQYFSTSHGSRQRGIGNQGG